MKYQLNVLVAAMAVALSGAAHAKLTDFDNQTGGDGNSSLTFVALDKVGTPISITADLGYFFDQFRAKGSPGKVSDGMGGLTDGYLGSPSSLANAPGTKIIWNFSNNTTSVNGAVSASTNGKANAWSTKFTSFYATATHTDTKWGVIAGDTANYYGDGSDIGAPIAASGSYQDAAELSTTADPTQPMFQTRLNGTLASNVTNGVGSTQTFMAAVRSKDTATGNGAVVATAGSGAQYAGDNHFQGNWGGQFKFSVLTNEGKAQDFYHMTGLPTDPNGGDTPYVTKYPGYFEFDGTKLSYTVPVPEPETYGLALAGLLVVAGIARRRAAK